MPAFLRLILLGLARGGSAVARGGRVGAAAISRGIGRAVNHPKAQQATRATGGFLKSAGTTIVNVTRSVAASAKPAVQRIARHPSARNVANAMVRRGYTYAQTAIRRTTGIPLPNWPSPRGGGSGTQQASPPATANPTWQAQPVQWGQQQPTGSFNAWKQFTSGGNSANPAGMQGPQAAPSLLEKANDAISALAKGIGNVLGPAAKFTVKAAGASLALAGLAEGAKRFIGALVDSRRELSMFSGSISVAMARLDVNKLQLQARTAGATAGSTAGLTNAYSDLLDELQPIRENVITLTNNIAMWGAKVLAIMVVVGKHMPFAASIDAAIKKLDKPDPGGGPMREFVRDTADTDWADRFPPIGGI